MPKLIALIRSLATGLAICFPLYLWFAGWDHPLGIAIYLVVTGYLKFISSPTGPKSAADWIMILAPILFGVLVIFLGSRVGLYYPAIVSFSFFLVFYTSLLTPKSFIQRIAEKIEKHPLDSVGVLYTNRVTRIWCVFFFLNTLLPIFLAWRYMLDMWMLYNGVVAYFLIGFLIVGERLMRDRLQGMMRRKYEMENG